MSKVSDDQITVSKSKYLEALVRAELAPLIAERKFHPGTVVEWASRLVSSGACDLEADGSLRQRVPIAEWLDQAVTAPGNRHLAQAYGETEPTEQKDARFGGMSQDAFDRLPARRKLDLANEQAFARSKAG